MLGIRNPKLTLALTTIYHPICFRKLLMFQRILRQLLAHLLTITILATMLRLNQPITTGNAQSMKSTILLGLACVNTTLSVQATEIVNLTN
jgi:hypothetical protein